jgi:hypothetical protein
MGSGDTLEEAFSKHRLYVTDYKVLSDIVPGTVEIKKIKTEYKNLFMTRSLYLRLSQVIVQIVDLYPLPFNVIKI